MATGIEISDGGVWHLGIHGARNAGKTCFLACLYGFRANGKGTAVGFADNQTIDYLSEKWDRYLARGQKPRPTDKGIPSELRCHVKCEQRVWHVALRDYAGELVERSNADDVAQLRSETREWLMACNAILFFLDITESPAAIRERLNELDLLLGELHKLSADGNTIARPLALVLTKWDSHADFSLYDADPEKEGTKARLFLSNDPMYGQFHAALEQSGDRVQVFPISAFGSHRDDQQPPSDGPQPFNIHSPLVWSVQRAEDMVAQKAEREAEAFTAGAWPHYARAIDTLQYAIRRYRLHKGSAGVRLHKRISTLRWRLWRRRILITASFAALVLVVASVVLFRDDQSRFRTVVSTYTDPSVNSAGIKSQADEYLSHRNPFRGILGHDIVVRRLWSQLQAEASQRDFQILLGFRNDHLSESAAMTRFAKDQEYLELWSGGSQGAKVTAWQMEDSAATDMYTKRVAHESKYRSLLEEVAALSKGSKYAEAIEKYQGFLADFPESPYRTDIEKSISDMTTARDESEWKAVVDFDQSHPDSFSDTIEKAGKYLNSPGATHRDEAEALVTRTGDHWDLWLYENVRNASRGGNDANSIESTQRKAMAYLNGTQPRRRMETEVQRWMDWFNGLQEEKDYQVVVRSMTIPKGSHLEPTASDPTCRIQISLNGTDHWTGWRDGMAPVYGETLGPYRVKWGQTGTFGVHIEGYHHTYWNDLEVKPPETDPVFIASRLNGPVTVRDRDGKDILIYLECEAVKQPDLSPYKATH